MNRIVTGASNYDERYRMFRLFMKQIRASQIFCFMRVVPESRWKLENRGIYMARQFNESDCLIDYLALAYKACEIQAVHIRLRLQFLRLRMLMAAHLCNGIINWRSRREISKEEFADRIRQFIDGEQWHFRKWVKLLRIANLEVTSKIIHWLLWGFLKNYGHENTILTLFVIHIQIGVNPHLRWSSSRSLLIWCWWWDVTVARRFVRTRAIVFTRINDRCVPNNLVRWNTWQFRNSDLGNYSFSRMFCDFRIVFSVFSPMCEKTSRLSLWIERLRAVILVLVE